MYVMNIIWKDTKMTLRKMSKSSTTLIVFLSSGIDHQFTITCSVGFIFGAILSAAGICGLILGSGLSFWLRKRLPWIDPVICGLGLLVSTPLIFVALYVLDTSVNTTFVLMFLGQIFLNMNWAVVVDISLVSQFQFQSKKLFMKNSKTKHNGTKNDIVQCTQFWVFGVIIIVMLIIILHAYFSMLSYL